MIRFFSLLALMLLASGAHAAHAAQTIFDSNFGQATKTFEPTAPDGAQIRGALPPDWSDYSSWQPDAKITYTPVEVAGVQAVRVTKTAGGEAQLRQQFTFDSSLPADAFYRLTVRARNPGQVPLVFGVRDGTDPWKTYWQAAPSFGDEWQTWSADFQLPAFKDDLKVGFYIFMRGNGSFDLAQTKLEVRSRDDVLNEIRDRYPNGGPANLLGQTRFPLGLQSGWAVNGLLSLGDELKINADPKTVGPSGVAALHITAPTEEKYKPLTLYSEPFDIARPEEAHTASFYVRGEGSGEFSVQRDFRNREGGASWSVTGADGWKRVVVPFTPALEGQLRALRWQMRGDVWLDALQVGPGAEAAPYAPRNALEVALAPGAGAASLVKIHFADETPLVRYAVTGVIPNGARLTGRIVSALGDEKPLAPMELNAQTASGTLRYDSIPNQKLGAFRVETRVEDAMGRALSPWNEIVMTRLVRPRYWGRDAPDSPFGTHINATRQNILMAKAAGLNWVRLHDAGSELLAWNDLEPQKGQWKWRDDGIDRLRDGNMEILGVLQTTPKWASVGQLGGNDYYDRYFLPADIEDWKNYVRRVGERYKGRINAYDILNEPWGFGYLNIGKNTDATGRGVYQRPADEIGAYLKLQLAAKEALAQVAPDAKALVDTSEQKWVERTLAEEKRDGVAAGDVLAFHLYGSGNPGAPTDVVSGRLDERRAWQREAEVASRPLWMTEGSAVQDRLFSGFYNHTLPTKSSENVLGNSDAVARYMVSLLAGGAQKMFLYTMGREEHFGSTPIRWAINIMEDGAPHPSLAATSALTYQLEDTQFVEWKTLAPDVRAAIFAGKDGKRSVAVVVPDGKVDYALPRAAGLAALDLFGNPMAPGAKLGATTTYLTMAGDAKMLEAALGE